MRGASFTNCSEANLRRSSTSLLKFVRVDDVGKLVTLLAEQLGRRSSWEASVSPLAELT